METGGLKIQNHSPLPWEFETSMGYLNSVSKRKKERRKEGDRRKRKGKRKRRAKGREERDRRGRGRKWREEEGKRWREERKEGGNTRGRIANRDYVDHSLKCLQVGCLFQKSAEPVATLHLSEFFFSQKRYSCLCG